MAGIIYIPVMDAEMRNIVTQWNKGRTDNQKTAYPVIAGTDHGLQKAARHKMGLGLLRRVGAGDKLYVLQHGVMYQGSNQAVMIGATRGGTVKTGLQGPYVVGGTDKRYTPDALAEHLEKEGLTKAIADLRIFACGSGVSEQQNGAQMPSYAQALKGALTQRGYAQVIVTGYLGNLIAKHDGRLPPGTKFADPDDFIGTGKGVILPGDTYATLASDHRVRF